MTAQWMVDPIFLLPSALDFRDINSSRQQEDFTIVGIQHYFDIASRVQTIGVSDDAQDLSDWLIASTIRNRRCLVIND